MDIREELSGLHKASFTNAQLNKSILESVQSQGESSYIHNVATGKVLNAEVWNKFGYNLDIDNDGSFEIMASWGGTFDPNINIMKTAQTFTITYNNLTDGAGKTGARQVIFYYLTGDFKLGVQVHTLGSTGTDITTFTGLGINRAIVFSNGGAGWNVNNITITATGDGTTQAQIPALGSVTQQMIFHTPKDYFYLAEWLTLNAIKTTGGAVPKWNVRGYSWSRVTQTRYEVFRINQDSAIRGYVELRPPVPFVIGGREVLYFTASTSQDNSSFQGRFSGVLRK